MMDEIKFSSVEEQMEKLEKQGLVIKNKESARLALSFFGYSNIIKSYRDPHISCLFGIKNKTKLIIIPTLYNDFFYIKECRLTI